MLSTYFKENLSRGFPENVFCDGTKPYWFFVCLNPRFLRWHSPDNDFLLFKFSYKKNFLLFSFEDGFYYRVILIQVTVFQESVKMPLCRPFLTYFSLAFALSLVLPIATAVFNCKGKISGVLNNDVLVSSGSCEIAVNATVNGSIFVKKGRSLSISDGATVNGNIRLMQAKRFTTHGRFNIVTINGQIVDKGGSGLFLLCGTKVTSGVSVLNRYGEVIIGFGSCSPNTLYGPVTIGDGKGDVSISGSQDGYTNATGNLNGLSIFNRGLSSDVLLWDTKVTDSIFVSTSGNVFIQRVTVLGPMKLTRNNFVQLIAVKQSGLLKVVSTSSIVVGSQVNNTGPTQIFNNKKGFAFSNCKFSQIQCFGNTGPPISIENSTVLNGQGQCAKFES